MTDVKNSRLYKTLKKAVRKEDHAELLRMLELASDSPYFAPEATGIIGAFPWWSSPQGFDYWFTLHCKLKREGHDCF